LNQLVYENVRIITVLLRKWRQRHNNKHFLQPAPRHGGHIYGMKKNNFAVSLCTMCPQKNAPKHVSKSSKLASFAQLQFNSMNICLFSIKLPILAKICPIVTEILTLNKWS